MTIHNPPYTHLLFFSMACLWILSSCSATSVKNHPTLGAIIPPSNGSQSSKIIYKATDHRPYIITKHPEQSSRRWLIDSGASESIIFASPRTSTDRGILINDSSATSHIHGLFSSKNVHLKSFRLKTENSLIISGFILPLNANNHHQKTDGIIGISTLTKNDASLDIQHKYLRWNDHTQPLNPSHVIRLTRHPKTGHLILSTRYNSITSPTLHFIIDTGASHSVITYQTARKLNIDFKATSQRLSGIYNSQGGISLIKKSTFIINEQKHIQIRNMLVADIPSIQGKLNHEETEPIAGVLGYPFLKKYCSSIHFGRGYLIFKE